MINIKHIFAIYDLRVCGDDGIVASTEEDLNAREEEQNLGEKLFTD